MNLIGRYQGVRGWNGRDLTVPYILDRKWGSLAPMSGEEWWRSPDGYWIPVVRGGIGFQGKHRAMRLGFPMPGSTLIVPSQNAIALSSSYTAGSTGNAIAGRLLWAAALTATNIYFFITSYTGTASSVTDINWEVRTGTSTTVTTSGGPAASGTVNPSSATGWIQAATGQSISVSADTYTYFIIADANGGATNFANVNARYSNWPDQLIVAFPESVPATTTNGFSTVSYPASVPGIVLIFNDGTTYGQPYTATANNSTNSTNRKGFNFSAGIYAPLQIFGFTCSGGDNNISGSEVYLNNAAPGSTPFATSAHVIKDGGGTTIGVLNSPSVQLPAFVPIRVVYTFSANSTKPQKANIGTGADANLRSSGIGGGSIYYAEANGTTNWANDDTNAFPAAMLLIDDQAIGPIVNVNE